MSGRIERTYCNICKSYLCGHAQWEAAREAQQIPEGALGSGAQRGMDIHEFTSGAKSSGRKPRYDLIPTHALERIARRFELGAEKYGVDNWRKGSADKDFILDRINHAIEHLLILRDQIHGYEVPTGDDDAAAVILNAIFIMEYQDAAARR